MPATKSQLLNKLKTKARGAWSKSREVEPKARGQGGFPPNLKGLVAVVKHWKFSETKNHDPMIQITGIVQDPEEYVGRRATMMYFINDSEYATVQDNLDNFANDVKLLIRPDEEVPGAPGPGELPDSIEDILDVLQYLCEIGRHFEFNTGQARKEGRSPNLFIQGIPDNWEDAPQEGAGEAVADEAARDGQATQAEGEAGDDQGSVDGPDETTRQDADADAPADDEPWEPEVKQEYYTLYKATPKDKAKKVAVKITKVDKKKFTVDAKLSDPKYKGKELKGLKWKPDGSGDLLGEEY